MFNVLAGMISGPQLAIIVILVILLFGAKKLPELARGIGKSMGEFRKAREEFDKELEDARKNIESPPSSPAVPEQIVSREDYATPVVEEPSVSQEKTEDKA